jgi:hypothetical protein
VARLKVRQRSRWGGSTAGIWWGGTLIGLAVLSLAALAYFYFTVPRKPILNASTLCPVSGPQGIVVILVDTSDDLPPTTQQEVRTLLMDQITGLADYYRLDIRVLDIPTARSRSLFSRCNPGDGSGLSEWTNNPHLARMRWIKSFEEPAEQAIGSSLAPAKAKKSPIMGAIQNIALEEFSAAAVRDIPKSLIVISDMLEFTSDYGQYPSQGDLSFERYKKSAAYLKYRTDLHGAQVTIDYVQRALQTKIDTVGHVYFWKEWILDNQGTLKDVHRLQGI